MNESLKLFENISGAKWFERTTLILCFTKMGTQSGGTKFICLGSKTNVAPYSIFPSTFQEQADFVPWPLDMFIKKIRTGSRLLKEEYPDYKGGDRDVNAAREFFTQKFELLAKQTSRILPRIHYLDATRVDRVRCVLDFIFKDGGPLTPEIAGAGDIDNIGEPMDEADWQDLEIAWTQKMS